MGSKGAPDPPDYAAAARQSSYAQAETYPMTYLIDAAARMGRKVTIDGKTYDFTGMGDADNAAVLSDQMAQTLLDLQRSYGGDYIRQRLEELKQADPDGYAARQQLFDSIMASAEANPDRPLAEDLQAKIAGELANAGRLDARQTSEVQQGVRGRQVRAGNYLGTAASTQEAENVVKASDAAKAATQQQALDFLGSGVTPEDVEYRRIQQAISNLTSFQNSESPVAQFRSLSSAGNGAVPFQGGGPGPTPNANTAAQGAQNALDIYGGQVNWYRNQANPYLAGFSTLTSGAGTLANAGWRPWGTRG